MKIFWKAWYTKHFPGNWKKCMKTITLINKWFKENGVDIKYSILKQPNIDYLIKIDEALETYIKEKDFKRSNRGKHGLAKYCDEFKEYAKHIFKYLLSYDLLDGRNSFSKTNCDATYLHMKYDYYNHTNVFKPGYNVQVVFVNLKVVQ